ncbi:MAG: cadherin-like domain-containing protein, partial [Cyclobacteriaceae bacterium]
MRNVSKLFLILSILALTSQASVAQIVTSTANSGEGSLRQVITNAASGSIIVFALEPGSVIRLNTQITLSKSLTLMGPGADRLTISGDSDSDNTGETRIFNVTDGTLTLRNLRLDLGSSGTAGAAVLVDGSSAGLDVADCEFTNNNAAQAGGAIAVIDRGRLFVSRTLFLSNFVTTPASSSGGGGAIYLDTDREIDIENCTFSQNTQRGLFAARGGGAILGVASSNDNSRFNFINNTFYQNNDLRFAANISDAIMLASNGADAKVVFRNSIYSENGLNSISVNGNYDVDSKNNIADDEPAVFDKDDLPNTEIALGNLNKNGGAVRNHSIQESSPAKDFSRKPLPDFDTRRFLRLDDPDAGSFETNAQVNESPSISSTANMVATEGLQYIYNITATDPENDNLVIVAIQMPDWLTFTATNNGTPSPTAQLTGTPGDADAAAGPYTIVIQLTDGINLSRQEFSLTVNNVNDPPVLVNNNAINVAEGASVTITDTNLLVSDSDQNSRDITYSVVTQVQNGTLLLNGNSSPTVFAQSDINQGRLLYRHDDSETTSDSFRVRVSDGAGGTISTFTVNINVTPVNDPPTIVNNNGLSIDLGATATITDQSLLATDKDNSAVQLTYTLT